MGQADLDPPANPELEEMLARADEKLGAGAEAAAADVVEQPQISRDVFVDITWPAVRALGNFACAKAKVTPIDENEAKPLAVAIYQLCMAYDALGQLSERAAAWLGLGLTVAAVVGNRRPIIDQAPQRPSNDTASSPG